MLTALATLEERINPGQQLITKVENGSVTFWPRLFGVQTRRFRLEPTYQIRGDLADAVTLDGPLSRSVHHIVRILVGGLLERAIRESRNNCPASPPLS